MVYIHKHIVASLYLFPTHEKQPIKIQFVFVLDALEERARKIQSVH